MRVLLNCFNLRFGGGMTGTIDIIKGLSSNRNNKFIVIAPKLDAYYQFRATSNIRIIFFPSFTNKIYFKPVANYLLLPLLSLFYRPQIVISAGNIAFPCFFKQILLIRNAYLVYQDSPVWYRLNANQYTYNNRMVKYMKFNLRFADFYFLQTSLIQRRFLQQFHIPLEKTDILPNSISLTNLNEAASLVKVKAPTKNETIHLLVLSKYYAHKNLEILLPLAQIIHERQLPIKFSITLDKKDGKDTEPFLLKIKEHKVENIVENIGHVALNEIANVYTHHNGLFLPTLLESFSRTYLEAMYLGKPIFTSNLDFAYEICKDIAFYFNPLDANEIIETITNAYSHPDLLKQRVEKGREYASEFTNKIDYEKILIERALRLIKENK